jgi:hypothetical protein
MPAKLLACTTVAFLCAAKTATSFQGFYSSEASAAGRAELFGKPSSSLIVSPLPDDAKTTRTAPDASVCIAAIKSAEESLGLPSDLLLAIGLQEAGTRRDGVLTIWPWTINSQGTGYRFDSAKAAIAFAENEIREGRRSFDVGGMQVNMRWHGDAFKDLEDAFDPFSNTAYAGRFLKNLKSQAPDWITAAGNYHSRTPSFHERYVDGIHRNLSVARKKSEHFTQLAQTTSISTETYDSGSSHKPHDKTPWWFAELNGSNSEKRTIYSDVEIEPVMPMLVAPPS